MADRQTSRQILLCLGALQHGEEDTQTVTVVDIKQPMIFGRSTCPYFRHPSISRRHFLVTPATGGVLLLKALGMHGLVVEKQKTGHASDWIVVKTLQKGDSTTLHHGTRFFVEALADVSTCYVWYATDMHSLHSHLAALKPTVKPGMASSLHSKHTSSQQLPHVSQSPKLPCTPMLHDGSDSLNECEQSSSPVRTKSHGCSTHELNHHTNCTKAAHTLDNTSTTSSCNHSDFVSHRFAMPSQQQCAYEGSSMCSDNDMQTKTCKPRTNTYEWPPISKVTSNCCITAEDVMSQPLAPATPEQLQTPLPTCDNPEVQNITQTVKRRRLREGSPNMQAGLNISQQEVLQRLNPPLHCHNSHERHHSDSGWIAAEWQSSAKDTDSPHPCDGDPETGVATHSGLDSQIKLPAPSTYKTDATCQSNAVIDAGTTHSQLLINTPPILDTTTLVQSQVDIGLETLSSETQDSSDCYANGPHHHYTPIVRKELAGLSISGGDQDYIKPGVTLLEPADTGLTDMCHRVVISDDPIRSAISSVVHQDAPFGLTASSLDIPSEYNQGRLGVRLSQLVRGWPMQLVVAMSFPMALENMVAMCPDLLQAQQLVLVHELQDREVNLRQQAHKLGIGDKTYIHRPRIPWPYNERGCQHAKGFLIQYDAGLRVIIMSANLLSALDCDALTQSIWWQDFPLKDLESPETSDFELHMANFVQSWRLHNKVQHKVLNMLHRYDMSSARAALIASVPGLHTGPDLHKYGHLRVRQVLQQVPLPEGDQWQNNSSFVLQGTSLGSLNDVWIRQQLVSSFAASAPVTERTQPRVHGGRTVVVKRKKQSVAVRKREAARRSMIAVGANGRAVDRSRVFFMWPTSEEIHHAAARYYQGRICGLAGEYSYIRRPCLAPYMARYNGQATGRGHVVPHIKSYCRYSGQQVAWVMTGSHNCSKAAWGKLSMRKQDGKIKYEIWNYELSVLSAPCFEMAYRNHRHYGFNCLSALKSPSNAQSCTQPLQRVEFWSIQKCLQDQLAKHKQQGCPAQQSNTRCTETVICMPVHLPYHLPPERYHIGIDEPWTCDMLQEAPDIAGHGPQLGQMEQRIAKEQGFIHKGLHTHHTTSPTGNIREEDLQHLELQYEVIDLSKDDDSADAMSSECLELHGCCKPDNCSDSDMEDACASFGFE